MVYELCTAYRLEVAHMSSSDFSYFVKKKFLNTEDTTLNYF
jgi:hypothetical protein